VAGVIAADGDIAGEREPYLDIRAGWSAPTGMTVDEDVSMTGQPTAGYAWNNASHRGNRGSLGVVVGQDRMRGFLAGAGFSYTRWETTPTGYTGGSIPPTVTSSSRSNVLDAKLAMIDLQVGYAVGTRLNETLATWLELAPTLGLGVMTADSEAQMAPGQFRVESGSAFAYEYGLRGGWYFGEGNWLLGVTGAWAKTRSDVDITFSSNASSTLRLDSTGFRLGIEAGYRF
jgi:hypothetical protein